MRARWIGERPRQHGAGDLAEHHAARGVQYSRAIRPAADRGGGGEVPIVSRPAGDAAALPMGFGGEPAAVDGDDGGAGERRLADGAPARGAAGGGVKPAIDAGPAVEMAAESDHRIGNEVEADVAIKARVRRRRVWGAAVGHFR